MLTILSVTLIAKRIAHAESNLIYVPLRRLTNFVHSGIDRFSELNRRNAVNIRNKYKRRYGEGKSSDADINFADDDEYYYDN